MSKNVMSLMQTVKVIDVVFTIVLLVVITGFIVTQGKKLKFWLEQWRQRQNFFDKTNQSIMLLQKKDDELDCKINDIITSLNTFEETINSTRLLLQEKIEQDNKTNRSKLKSDIEKIYMLHKDTKEITTYQFESLKDLIASYERHGGQNSFVHSVVEVEMYTWNIVDLKNEMDNMI